MIDLTTKIVYQISSLKFSLASILTCKYSAWSVFFSVLLSSNKESLFCFGRNMKNANSFWGVCNCVYLPAFYDYEIRTKYVNHENTHFMNYFKIHEIWNKIKKVKYYHVLWPRVSCKNRLRLDSECTNLLILLYSL